MTTYNMKTVIDDLNKNNINYRFTMSFDTKHSALIELTRKTRYKLIKYRKMIYFTKREDFIWFYMRYDVKGTYDYENI